MFKRLLISFLAVIIAFFSIAPSAANAQWYNQDPVLWYKQVYDDSNPSEIFGERYTAAQVDWIIMSFLTWPATKFAGPEATSCFLEYIFGDSDAIDATACTEGIQEIADGLNRIKNITSAIGEETSHEPKSTLASFSSYVLSDRPISAISYVRYTIQKFSPVSTAHAQTGFGYQQFNGLIRQLWLAVRDFSYALFTLMAVALAFMVMFRVKTSPQTTITIQSAIPKLAIALILVTFSYAIAGFLVDLMYVVIGIISLFLEGQIPVYGAPDMFTVLTKGLYGGGFLFMLLFDIVGYPLALFLGFAALPASGTSGLNALFSGLLGMVGLVLALLLLIIMVIVVLVMWFKITFLLLKTTASIILLTIFAPIQITLGIIVPGIGFGAWFKSYLSHLAVFPVIGLLFSLSFLFLFQSIGESALILSSADWLVSIRDFFNLSTPELEQRITFGNGWPPLLSGAGNVGPLILMGVSLVILFIIPKTADLIKGLLSGRPLSYGQAVGEAIGPATTVGYGYANYRSSKSRTAYENESKLGVVTPRTDTANARWGFARSISGGKIK